MAIIWETIDRLERTVELTEEGWAHILFEHEELANRAEEVQDAVTYADEVVRDKVYTHRDIHYQLRGSGRRWLRVVVHYRPSDPSAWVGEVITAHFISRRDRREVPKWPSKNPL